MTDTVELLPCPSPWCEAAEQDGDYSPMLRECGFGNFQVSCTSCANAGPVGTTKHEAVTAWNNRPATVPKSVVDGLAEAAKKATEWMNHPQMGTWPYLEGAYFYSDKTRICGDLETNLEAYRKATQ